MAQIVRLRTPRQKLERHTAADLAEQLRLLPEDLLKQLPGVSRLAISRTVHALHRHAQADDVGGQWPGGFNMLSREQTKYVWDQIRALPASDRPHQVRHAFDLALLNLRQDTGEIMLRRDEIAAEIGCAPKNVSTIMGTLERIGAVRRERLRVEGIQGRGVAVYFINAHVAWNGLLAIRERVAEGQTPPLLKVMEGGKSAS